MDIRHKNDGGVCAGHRVQTRWVPGRDLQGAGMKRTKDTHYTLSRIKRDLERFAGTFRQAVLGMREPLYVLDKEYDESKVLQREV